MVVLPVDHRHIDRQLPQLHRRIDAPESRTHDDNARPPPCLNHARSLLEYLHCTMPRASRTIRGSLSAVALFFLLSFPKRICVGFCRRPPPPRPWRSPFATFAFKAVAVAFAVISTLYPLPSIPCSLSPAF